MGVLIISVSPFGIYARAPAFSKLSVASWSSELVESCGLRGLEG